MTDISSLLKNPVFQSIANMCGYSQELTNMWTTILKSDMWKTVLRDAKNKQTDVICGGNRTTKIDEKDSQSADLNFTCGLNLITEKTEYYIKWKTNFGTFISFYANKIENVGYAIYKFASDELIEMRKKIGDKENSKFSSAYLPFEIEEGKYVNFYKSEYVDFAMTKNKLPQIRIDYEILGGYKFVIAITIESHSNE